MEYFDIVLLEERRFFTKWSKFITISFTDQNFYTTIRKYKNALSFTDGKVKRTSIDCSVGEG